MSSGRTASEDSAFVEPEPEPSNATGPLSSAGAGLGKGERKGASSICACYCHLCVLFLFSFAFLTQPFFQQSLLAKLSIPGSPSGFGAAVSTFLAISVATETIQSSPANAPRRAFSFCYLCI